MENRTIFQKIIDGEVKSEILFEDEFCLVINDINPQAPTHVLIIPKKVIPRVSEATDEDVVIIGKLLLAARDFAKKRSLGSGFRLVLNNGPMAGETVPHLHVHLLAGRPMSWPPG
ncbi:MAG: histidine triad nucleotide-binding protein [Puniceicoccales bacterium]|jgi:histidine triad (HIT) family protein|nr:histidine triad nucleotide-binding protein [Puniceicoccales bacterium]